MISKKNSIEFFCIISVILASLIASLHPIPPADLWWQLSVGKFIDTHHEVLKTNIFSYSAPGFKITDHEWFAELLFYRIYTLGGLKLLYVFKSVVISLTFLIYYFICRKKALPPIPSCIGIIIAVFMSNLSFFGDVRPYIFTYLFLAVLLCLLLNFENKPNSLFYFLICLLVWANSHGGYMLFFALILIYLTALFIGDKRYKRFADRFILGNILAFCTRFKTLFIMFISGMFVVSINPYGLSLLLYPFSFSTDGTFRRGLVEWLKPDLLGFNLNFLIFFILFTLLILIYLRKFSLFELFLFGAFGFLSFSAVRHITLFAMGSSFILASLIHFVISDFKRFVAVRPLKLNTKSSELFLSCAVFLLFLTLFSIKSQNYTVDRLSMEKSHFPYNGIKFIHLNRLKGNIYHPYGWGGYLIWNLYPLDPVNYRVFIDGRANVAYPEDIYVDSNIMDFGYDGWKQIMDKFNINVALCSKYHMHNTYEGRSLPDRLAADSEWILVYEDRAEYIFVRKNSVNEEFLSKGPTKALRPISSFGSCILADSAVAQGDFQYAIELLLDVINLDMTYAAVPQKMAEILLKLDRFEDAYTMLEEGIRREPANTGLRNLKKEIELKKSGKVLP